MVKLRRFSLSGLKEMMEIEKMSFVEHQPRSYFKKLYKKHPDGFVIAELSKKVVGYVFGYKEPNGSGLIKTIAVNPDWRRQGIGKKLINFAINKLKKEGVREVFLHTRTQNKTASLFYKKLGFKTLKIIKNYYRNGDNAFLMKKELGERFSG